MYLGFLMPFVQVEIKSFDCLAYCSVAASQVRGKLAHVKVLYKVKVCFVANGNIGVGMTSSCVNCIVCIAPHCDVCFVSKCTQNAKLCAFIHMCMGC